MVKRPGDNIAAVRHVCVLVELLAHACTTKSRAIKSRYTQEVPCMK